jgi:hypothetical protein
MSSNALRIVTIPAARLLTQSLRNSPHALAAVRALLLLVPGFLMRANTGSQVPNIVFEVGLWMAQSALAAVLPGIYGVGVDAALGHPLLRIVVFIGSLLVLTHAALQLVADAALRAFYRSIARRVMAIVAYATAQVWLGDRGPVTRQFTLYVMLAAIAISAASTWLVARFPAKLTPGVRDGVSVVNALASWALGITVGYTLAGYMAGGTPSSGVARRPFAVNAAPRELYWRVGIVALVLVIVLRGLVPHLIAHAPFRVAMDAAATRAQHADTALPVQGILSASGIATAEAAELHLALTGSIGETFYVALDVAGPFSLLLAAALVAWVVWSASLFRAMCDVAVAAVRAIPPGERAHTPPTRAVLWWTLIIGWVVLRDTSLWVVSMAASALVGTMYARGEWALAGGLVAVASSLQLVVVAVLLYVRIKPTARTLADAPLTRHVAALIRDVQPAGR